MNEQNRVLIRKGARELTEREVEEVNGGLRTATLCTCCEGGGIDGDTGECGGVW